ncbi:hypothetical protein OPV22_034090 [Ensete ventricosum]|uniref:Uncharacterized protein n=1 Tax=Ensete ventricosum TaxID=4639 RepID=A0AAV8PVY7_ENSVE|nr:hypothetical protein OPV22_034090 [Ensete ventricosum]
MPKLTQTPTPAVVVTPHATTPPMAMDTDACAPKDTQAILISWVDDKISTSADIPSSIHASEIAGIYQEATNAHALMARMVMPPKTIVPTTHPNFHYRQGSQSVSASSL